MAENKCSATDQVSPDNQEAEMESPDNGGVPQVVSAGEGAMIMSPNLAIVVSGNSFVPDSGSVARLESEGSGKRKRGRPRKYDRDASSAVQVFSGATASPSEPSLKRGRGRPKGSGKLQLLGPPGGLFSSTAGRSFIPHVESVNTGEDVVGRISSFAQKGPQAVCVLSATGTVSSAIIRQPGSSGGNLRHEGLFEILTLSGSYAFCETPGGHRKLGMLSASLAKPDGLVFGGAVVGSLVAAGPIQLVVGTFRQNFNKEVKRKRSMESSMAPVIPRNPDMVRAPDSAVRMTYGDENCPTPTSQLAEPNNGGEGNIVISNQTTDHVSVETVCWTNSQTSQPMSDQRTSHEIDASVPDI